MKIKAYYPTYMGYPTTVSTFYKKLKDVRKVMNEHFGQELVWKDCGFPIEYGFRSEEDYETAVCGTAHAPWLNAVCTIHKIELEIVE